MVVVREDVVPTHVATWSPYIMTNMFGEQKNATRELLRNRKRWRLQPFFVLACCACHYTHSNERYTMPVLQRRVVLKRFSSNGFSYPSRNIYATFRAPTLTLGGSIFTPRLLQHHAHSKSAGVQIKP